MSFYDWKPRVSAAQRRKKAESMTARAKKAGTGLSPVPACRGAIAKTFWGRAWCENLERYSDFANRLPRGRTYMRSGSVIDLKIAQGEVHAQVVGSRVYEVAVKVVAVPKTHWQSISADCSGSIDSLVELLQGRFSKAVMERICAPNTGLFPAPKDIQFSCSCPDWAFMCKHVAAVLYGVGARLDEQPELIFTLRRADAKELVMQAGTGLAASAQPPISGKVLDDSVLGDVFGIEMADMARVAKPLNPRHSATRKAALAGHTRATKSRLAAQTPAKGKAAPKPAGRASESTTSKVKNQRTRTSPQRKTVTTQKAAGGAARKKAR